jgi:methionyl-tRNA formyltransferase
MISFTFFGTSDFSIHVLEALKTSGLLPSHIITTPDMPQGRKLIITPTKVKLWAIKNNIPFIQPENLKSLAVEEELKKYNSDLFIVASYGKIIPQNILDIPSHKTLNVHPSLLPKLRGASPIQTAILEEEKTGVTIIRLDEKMDHGPIIAQKNLDLENWRTFYEKLENTLGQMGGFLLAEILQNWVDGKIIEKEQDHDSATYTKKIEKVDGLISPEEDAEKNMRKILAFSVWPGTYFFTQKNGKEIRVIITEAEIVDGKLEIKKVVPESKKEMSYKDFLKG